MAAFQLSSIVVFTALLYFSTCGVTLGNNAKQSQLTKPSKHGEIYRAKSEIDALIFKLSLDFEHLHRKEKSCDHNAERR